MKTVTTVNTTVNNIVYDISNGKHVTLKALQLLCSNLQISVSVSYGGNSGYAITSEGELSVFGNTGSSIKADESQFNDFVVEELQNELLPTLIRHRRKELNAF